MATYVDADSSTLVTFKLQLASPGVDGDAAVDDRHIPGGNQNFIDLGGQTTQKWDAEGMFSSYADFQTVLGLRGGHGTLAYTEDVLGTTVSLSVVLKKVARRKVTGRGEQFCTLSFLIL